MASVDEDRTDINDTKENDAEEIVDPQDAKTHDMRVESCKMLFMCHRSITTARF